MDSIILSLFELSCLNHISTITKCTRVCLKQTKLVRCENILNQLVKVGEWLLSWLKATLTVGGRLMQTNLKRYCVATPTSHYSHWPLHYHYLHSHKRSSVRKYNVLFLWWGQSNIHACVCNFQHVLVCTDRLLKLQIWTESESRSTHTTSHDESIKIFHVPTLILVW